MIGFATISFVFFEGKPNFILIELADLSWKTLCPFLDKSEPAIPFPQYNSNLR